MTTILLVLQVALVIVITISVLLQKSSSIGLGQYSGSNESLFGAKGPAGFLAKFTAVMGILFVINTLALAYFYQQDAKSSILDSVDTSKMIEQNAVPNTPSVPAAPQTNAPVAPIAPAAPVAPVAPQSGDNTIGKAVEDAKNAAQKLEQDMQKAIDSAEANMTEGMSKAVINVEENLTQATQNAVSAVEGNLSKASEKIENVAGSVESNITAIANEANKTASEAADKAKEIKNAVKSEINATINAIDSNLTK